MLRGMPDTRRTTARSRLRHLAAASAVTSLVAASTMLVSSPAHAAWKTGSSMNGAHTQVCKVPLANGDVRVKVRLDNRATNEVYRGTLMRLSGKEISVVVRAAGGTISGTKSLRVRPGAFMGTGIGSPRGDLGGAIGYARDLPRC